MSETVHIHKARVYNSFNVFLLLIPPLLFVLTLAAIFLSSQTQNKLKVSITNGYTVLGENKELDK